MFGLLFDVNHLLSCYCAELCSRAIGVREIRAPPRPPKSSVHARTRSTGTGAAVLSTRKRAHVHTHTQTGGIIYGEAAASRMMKGFQPLSPCPCVRMSHRPNHKIVIEVSDVATLSAIAVVV